MFVSSHIDIAELNPMSVATHLLQTMKNVISESHRTVKYISIRLLSAAAGPSQVIWFCSRVYVACWTLVAPCAIIDHARFYLRHVTANNYMWHDYKMISCTTSINIKTHSRTAGLFDVLRAYSLYNDSNLMNQLLFIHKIIFSPTCFEPQVLIFRRIQLYTCSIWYCHSLWEFFEFSLKLWTDRPPRTLIESDSTICCTCTTVSSWRWALEARNI